MRSFIKIFFATMLALVVFSVVALILVVSIFSMAASSGKVKTGENAVLVVDLSKQFKEQKQENPLGGLVPDAEDVPSLYTLVQLIKHAKTDENIKGIYIKANGNANGYAASQELRYALYDFKKSKKFVIAYGEMMSQDAYYIASVADRVYCNPKGIVEWKGLSSTVMFFKGTLEKLDIQPQVFYAGKFKSATEPFREYKMTDANRLQTSVYLNDLYAHFLMAAAGKSGSDTAYVHQLADAGTIQNAMDAVNHKLIDAVKYDDEIKSELLSKLKLKTTDKINFVNTGKYAQAVDLFKAKGDRVALIIGEGEIIDGKGKPGQIGSEDFSEIIRMARLDKSIKAIVLRVNSPGGSALASEVILREIILAKKVKPVVVSFGDVAASGGYYISCGADSIFAQPTTITGSIGVFALIPNMGSFFQNKLGITFDRVKTGPYADMIPIDRAMNEGEKRFIQNAIDTIYYDFKSRVATGRNMTMERVDSIAQGRVWTGSRAVNIGLVDRLGNIQDAVNCAVRLAKLSDYRIKEYPETKGFLENLVSRYSTEVKVKAIKEEIGVEQYEMFQQLKSIKSMFTIPQARLPVGFNR